MYRASFGRRIVHFTTASRSADIRSKLKKHARAAESFNGISVLYNRPWKKTMIAAVLDYVSLCYFLLLMLVHGYCSRIYMVFMGFYSWTI